jgi:putative chitinase
MKPLSAEQLHQLFPGLDRKKCREYAPHFSAAAAEAKINTRARLCAFVAQLGHESQDLKFLREIWGNTPAQVRYDVRVDLGNTPDRDGDGKKYMGRGGLQRTGKANYRRAQEALGLPLLDHPELLEKPENAFRSDALYWTDNNLNRLADKLTLRGDAADLKQLDKITKAINGGYNGRVDRQRRYLVAIATLPEELFVPETPPSAFDKIPPPLPEIPPSNDEPKSAAENVLLQKLSANASAKAAGLSMGRKLLTRLAGPFSLLLAALEAGNLYAWLGVIVLIAGVGVLIYFERKPIARGIQLATKWVQKKFSLQF